MVGYRPSRLTEVNRTAIDVGYWAKTNRPLPVALADNRRPSGPATSAIAMPRRQCRRHRRPCLHDSPAPPDRSGKSRQTDRRCSHPGRRQPADRAAVSNRQRRRVAVPHQPTRANERLRLWRLRAVCHVLQPPILLLSDPFFDCAVPTTPPMRKRTANAPLYP